MKTIMKAIEREELMKFERETHRKHEEQREEL